MDEEPIDPKDNPFSFTNFKPGATKKAKPRKPKAGLAFHLWHAHLPAEVVDDVPFPDDTPAAPPQGLWTVEFLHGCLEWLISLDPEENPFSFKSFISDAPKAEVCYSVKLCDLADEKERICLHESPCRKPIFVQKVCSIARSSSRTSPVHPAGRESQGA